MSVWFIGPPAFMGEFFHLGVVLLELFVECIVQEMVVNVRHEYNSLS